MIVSRFMQGTELSRRELSELSRAMYDNSGHAAYAVDTIAIYAAPVTVKSASGDKDWDDEADAWFEDWATRCDFLGRPEVDFEAIQKEICAATDLDGDRACMVTDVSGFPQIQTIEGHRINSPDKHPECKSTDGGVGFDEFGRVVGYYVEGENGGHEFFSSASFYIVRDISPVTSFRGISPMRRGLNDLRDARDIVGFEKNGMKTLGSLPGVIKGGFSDEAKQFNTSLTEDGNEDEEAPANGAELPKGVTRMDLTGSDIPVLEEGQEFQKVESNRPNAQFGEFMDSLVGVFSSGLGIPPAFFLDSKMTGPGWRAVIGKAQRKFDERGKTLAALAKWVRARVIGWAIDKGQLRDVPNWDRVTVQRPSRITIDLGDEAAADREAVGSRLMSRSAFFGKRNQDWEDVLDQTKKEDLRVIAQCQDIATKTGVPVEVVLARYGFESLPKPTPPGRP